MIPLNFLFLISVGSIVGLNLNVAMARAEESRSAPYSLSEIVTLAIERSPTIAGAHGAMKQSRGQQIAAGAYLNPSVSGTVAPGLFVTPAPACTLSNEP